MRQTLSTNLQAQPILIIQGAYARFCAPATAETVYNSQEFRLILASPEAIVMAAQATWLKFLALVTAWREQRGAMSSITESSMCAAYQSIIGMGEQAVPFLMSMLKAEGEDADQWFWALKAITGTDPVGDDDRGNYVAMARAWLAWGRLNGYAR